MQATAYDPETGIQQAIAPPVPAPVLGTAIPVQAPISGHTRQLRTSTRRTRRYSCSHLGCTTSVARHSDLTRHMRTHQAGPKPFDCLDPGCNRKGVNGFGRRDKMMDHYNAVH